MKDIPGYEGLYAATEDGQIWSYKRRRFLKQNANSKGYLSVNLCKDGNPKTYQVHRLIALTYIPNTDNLPVIDHIDRNKLNNSIENLRWVTVKENNMNTDPEQRFENACKATQTSVQVRSKAVEMRDKNNHNILLKTYPSCHQAAIQEFGDAMKQSGISKCARGKQNSAYGYFWAYIDPDVSYEEKT